MVSQHFDGCLGFFNAAFDERVEGLLIFFALAVGFYPLQERLLLCHAFFAVFNFKASFMRRKGIIKMEVSPEEEELIKAIRNYCNSYPNGYPDLLGYAEDLFQRMTDMPKD